MQLSHLDVSGLFGRFDQQIPFPTRAESDPTASVVIVHGPNGVGKTTVLRMLDGLMRLDFTTFRRVPFGRCALSFTTGQQISVEHDDEVPGAPLRVSFEGLSVLLDPNEKGAFRPEDQPLIEEFRSVFYRTTAPITFTFIETSRFPPEVSEANARNRRIYRAVAASGPIDDVLSAQVRPSLADRIRGFIADAQVDSTRFFTSTESSLFARILANLGGSVRPIYDIDQIEAALTAVQARDHGNQRFGLTSDPWDFGQLMTALEQLRSNPSKDYALTVMATYLEVLESRAAERQLVADRLTTFESIMNDYLLDKLVRCDRDHGLRILLSPGFLPQPSLPLDAGVDFRAEELKEDQLSSGEYHLLYLMVASLVTRRLGTVIAIDEPEMSMHISWQRRLVRDLVRCASNASPQFVFATHSPDIVADYSDALVDFGAAVHK